MKNLLVLIAFAVTSASAFDPGLRVKFDIGLNPGVDFFFDIPRSLSAALLQGWTFSERPPGPHPILVLFCHPERTVCALFDDTGYIAGLQIAIPQDEFTDAVFDWETQGYTEWTPPTATGEVIKYWTIQQYFISAEYLAVPPQDRIANRNFSKLLQEDAVWLTGFNGDLDRVSGKTSDIAESIFTEQACISWMGLHYYYNMSAETICESDTFYPWFPMVHGDNLIASGLILFGQLTIKEDARDWFERPQTLVVQAIVPRGPECLYNLTENVGLVTMHIYYIDEPWTITCD